VFATAALAVNPVRDAATLEALNEVRLDLSPAYLSIEPVSNVLDTLTLLTVGQHIAILLWAIGAFALYRVIRVRKHRPTLTPGRETLLAGAFLGAVVLVYAIGAMAPRPMAQLTTEDPTIVTIDFHSHTKYSHDGRPGWTEEDVRGWHRGAGYDATYITDHATYEGAERGISTNPGQAGEGTMILQGIEVFYHGEHVNLLSAGRRFKGITTADLKDVDEQALALANLMPQTSPVAVETIPGKLENIVAAPAAGGPGVRAIEIVDGSPRGLSQGRRERQRIVHLADSLNLALVTGSDNHGWGRTAPGWTLMRIPEWRGMATDSLSRRVESILRTGRRDATRTVERRVAGATNPVALVFAPPLVLFRMFTALLPDERVMWLIWTWVLVVLVRGVRAYRAFPSARA